MLKQTDFANLVLANSRDVNDEYTGFVTTISHIFYTEYLEVFRMYSFGDKKLERTHEEYELYMAEVFLPTFIKRYYEACKENDFNYKTKEILNIVKGSYTDKLAIAFDFLMFVLHGMILILGEREDEDNF